MTSSQIEDINTVRKNMSCLWRRHEEDLAQMQHEHRQLTRQCDHTNPDGTSAIEGEGRLYNICHICLRFFDKVKEEEPKPPANIQE